MFKIPHMARPDALMRIQNSFTLIVKKFLTCRICINARTLDCEATLPFVEIRTCTVPLSTFPGDPHRDPMLAKKYRAHDKMQNFGVNFMDDGCPILFCRTWSYLRSVTTADISRAFHPQDHLLLDPNTADQIASDSNLINCSSKQQLSSELGGQHGHER